MSGIQPIVSAQLRVFKPDNESDSPDFIVPGDHPEHGLLSFTVSPRARDEIDQGQVHLVNSDGRYGLGEHHITRGDRVEWYAGLDGPGYGNDYGMSYGTGMTHRWTGMVGETEHERVARGVAELTLDVEDFVFGVLSDRIVHRVFDNEPIHDIIQTLVDLKADEIDTDLAEVDETATVVSQGLNVLEIVTSLAKRADCVLVADGTTLVMEKIEDLSPAFTIDMDSGDLQLPFSVRTNPDDLVNFVRLDGGDANSLDEAQTEQDSWELVTDEQRITQRLRPTRSRADRIEIFTRTVTGSNDRVRVRIQRDDGGSPVDIEDPTADIVNETAVFDTKNEDWTVLFLEGHTFHDQDPWLIVEAAGHPDIEDSDGSDGFEAGINTDNDLTFRTFYRYPIIAEQGDTESQTEFRRIERAKQDESIRTFGGAVDEAENVIERFAQPRKEFQAGVMSERLQSLDIGTMLTLDLPEQGATGDYLLASKQDSWAENGTLFETTVTLQEAASL